MRRGSMKYRQRLFRSRLLGLIICLGAATLIIPTLPDKKAEAEGASVETEPFTASQAARSFSVSGTVRTEEPRIRIPDSSTRKPPGIEGVQIIFERTSGTGPLPQTVTSDANGNWTQSGFQTGVSYRARPSKQGFSFSPPRAEFSGPPATSLIFTGSFTGPFTISGRVTTRDGRPIPGVTISFPGGSTQTLANGQWSKSGIVRGTDPTAFPGFKVTPSKQGLDFVPPFHTYLFTGSRTDLNFQGISFFTASGRVTNAEGSGIGGVSIIFSRASGEGAVPQPGRVVTDANGEWALRGFEDATTYKATPRKEGLSFVPDDTHLSAERSRVNFMGGRLFAVSGKVVSSSGEALNDARVRFIASNSRAPLPRETGTNLNGRWSQSGFLEGVTYAAIASKDGFEFDVKASPSGLRGNVFFSGFTNDLVIAGSATTFRIGGLIIFMEGNLPVNSPEIAGVRVTITVERGPGRAPSPVTTDFEGRFVIGGLQRGTVYRLTLRKQGFSFEPASITVDRNHFGPFFNMRRL